MKPMDLYKLICSLSNEKFNNRKISFYMLRAKLALENLHTRGWDDEQIKVLVYNTVRALAEQGQTTNFQFVVSILCNTVVTPGVTSTEDNSGDYSDWIEQEKKRVGNAK